MTDNYLNELICAREYHLREYRALERAVCESPQPNDWAHRQMIILLHKIRIIEQGIQNYKSKEVM